MVQKIPPPPPLASNDPAFNRWLLELTAILNANGDIDPGSIQGLPALQAQADASTAAIGALTPQTNTNTADIATLNGQVSSLNTRMGAAETNISALQVRAQVFNGTAAPGAGLGADNDWFYNRTGAVGARLYIKVAGAWVAQAI